MSRHQRTPEQLLVLMSIAMPLAFAIWMTLLNNFTIERAAFTGAEIGVLQSIREVPGFLAFTAVFVLLVLREQPFALLSLLLLGAGVAVTSLFPSTWGLYATTLLMSVGFHYYETLKQSLTLQWIDRERAPAVMGRLVSVGALASLIAYAALWLCREWLGLDYALIYALGGGACMLLVGYMAVAFPVFPARTEQRKGLVLRRRYWLFYALTFLSGARRQIFVVFAGFLLVEKFGYSVSDIAALFLLNHLLSWRVAGWIGRWIGRVGERRALGIEYVGLILVFLGYAVVEDHRIAAGLYVLDHVFYAMAIGIKTYFQKIADPADIASTAGVSFTINHIAAVLLPASLGLLWLWQPGAVFVVGAGFALLSLDLSRLIPTAPAPGAETVRTAAAPVAAAVDGAAGKS